MRRRTEEGGKRGGGMCFRLFAVNRPCSVIARLAFSNSCAEDEKDEENKREGRVQLQVAGRIPLHALGTLCGRWVCRCVYLTGPAL